MSKHLAPVESNPHFTASTLHRRPIFTAALGALLVAISGPVYADGTDVSADEVYSDGVTLLTFDGMPLDINGDGEVDLAIAANQGGAAVRSRYYPGNGDGTFDAPVLLNAGASSEIAAGDLNNDMILDLVQGRRDLTNLLYLGDGAGGLLAPTDVGTDTRRHLSLALGDLNDDGDLDIVVATGHPAGMTANPLEPNRFCLNDFVPLGTNTYTCADITADADNTRGIALADMDGDGDLDVIVGNDETTPGSNLVYLNQFVESGMTAVNFAAGVPFGDPDDQTSKILIGNLNGDGLPDIVTVNTISTAMQTGNGVNRFFINETAGGVFALSAAMDIGTDADKSSGGALADFDGDGDLDIAVANLQDVAGTPDVGARNSLYLNQFIETGTVSFAAGLDISADEHQSRELAAADINNDGLIDIVVGNQNNVAGVKDRIYLNNGNPDDPFGNGPFFTSTPVTTATEGVMYTYSITTSDPDAGDTLTITAPTLPAWLTLTDNTDRTATLTGTPAAGDVGANDVVLEVTDGTTTAMQSFTIDVAPAGAGNTAPIFTSVPVVAAVEGAVYTYGITTLDPDAGDMLTITAPTLPASGWLALTDNGDGTATLTGTPAAADVGMSNDVELEVSDGTAVGTQTFTITVAPAGVGNTAPTFTSTPVTDATVGTAYSYSITTEDADGDPLTITAPTLPAWLTFTDNGDGTATLTGTPADTDEGDHAVSLQVTDGTDTTMQDFTITVAAAGGGNAAPTFTSTAITDATVDTAYSYSITTEDADGDPLTITAPTLPAWLDFTDNGDGTATLMGTPAAADEGDHPVSLQVSDGTDTGMQDFTITVAEAAPPPPPPPPTRRDSGGGSLGLLSLLAMLGMAGVAIRRRKGLVG